MWPVVRPTILSEATEPKVTSYCNALPSNKTVIDSKYQMIGGLWLRFRIDTNSPYNYYVHTIIIMIEGRSLCSRVIYRRSTFRERIHSWREFLILNNLCSFHIRIYDSILPRNFHSFVRFSKKILYKSVYIINQFQQFQHFRILINTGSDETDYWINLIKFTRIRNPVATLSGILTSEASEGRLLNGTVYFYISFMKFLCYEISFPLPFLPSCAREYHMRKTFPPFHVFNCISFEVALCVRVWFTNNIEKRILSQNEHVPVVNFSLFANIQAVVRLKPGEVVS